jgi:ribonuclease P protein component
VRIIRATNLYGILTATRCDVHNYVDIAWIANIEENATQGNVAFFMRGRHTTAHVDEANIPTKKAKAPEDARIPRTHQDRNRQARTRTPPPQRPSEAQRVRAGMPHAQRLSGSAIRQLKPEKRLNSALFSLVIARTPGKSAFACTVSKKVSAKAVVRNTVKRRMRAAVRTQFPLPSDTSIVLIAKRESSQSTYSEIERDIAALFTRVRSNA